MLTVTKVSTELQHSVCRSFEKLHLMREEWDDLVGAVGGDLFSTFDWCLVWWRHFGQGRELEIHIFRRNGRVVAILPLFRELVRVGPLSIRAIRIIGCDHAGMTCNLAIEPRWLTPVLRQVFTTCSRLAPWDVIHWGPFPGYSESVDALLEAVSQEPLMRAERGNDYPHMVFDLPKDYGAYLEQLSIKERRNVRRDERRLEKNGSVSRGCVTEEADLEAAFTEFLQMHQAYWRGCGQLGHFGDWPGSELFHREMARRQFERRRLLLLQVRVNNEVIASEYCYRFGDRVHWILGARRLEIPGRIGFCTLARKSVEAGATLIDAMRGVYEYKHLLGARVTHQTSIIAVHRGVAARVRSATFRSAARLLDLMYYRVWYSRVAPRVPSLQRPLWRTWIRSRI